jgi:WD40 repeat protein
MNLNPSRRMSCLILLLLLLSGCSILAPTRIPLPTLVTILPSIPTDTPTPLPSATLTPTNTLPPTATFAALGAPLIPQPAVVPPQAPISLVNAPLLAELVRWDTVKGCDYQFCTLAVSPDGALLAVSTAAEGQPKGVYLYDLPQSRGLWYLPGESTRLLIFSPDSALLVDGSGQVWDTRTGEEKMKFTGIPPVSDVWGATFSKDGTRLAVSTKDALQLWNMDDGAISTLTDQLSMGIYAMAFSPDGTLMALAYNQGKLVLIDAATGAVVNTMDYGNRWFASVAFSPDGQTLAAGTTEGKALLLKTSDLSIVNTFNVTDSFWVTGVVFSPDGTLLVTGEMSNMQLWNAADGTLLASLGANGSFQDFFTFTADGRSIFLLNPGFDTSSIEWFGIAP